jgi:hypothetical protein
MATIRSRKPFKASEGDEGQDPTILDDQGEYPTPAELVPLTITAMHRAGGTHSDFAQPERSFQQAAAHCARSSPFPLVSTVRLHVPSIA